MTENISSPQGFVDRLAPLADELVVFARRMLDRAGDAQDVLQSALATAWRQRQRFVEGTNFRAWIYQHLVHEIRNANRRNARFPPALDAESIPDRDFWKTLDAEVAYRELLSHPASLLDRLDQDLAGALGQLSEPERLVLLLRAIGDLRCGEIAGVLGVPKGTVMARLFRARVKLRRTLGESSRFSQRAGKRSDL